MEWPVAGDRRGPLRTVYTDRGTSHAGASMTAATALDTALDRTLIGYGNLGYLIRRTFWAADPAPDALRGKVAIVTGANSGLGKATAAGLARLGASVRMIVDRKSTRLNSSHTLISYAV